MQARGLGSIPLSLSGAWPGVGGTRPAEPAGAGLEGPKPAAEALFGRRRGGSGGLEDFHLRRGGRAQRRDSLFLRQGFLRGQRLLNGGGVFSPEALRG